MGLFSSVKGLLQTWSGKRKREEDVNETTTSNTKVNFFFKWKFLKCIRQGLKYFKSALMSSKDYMEKSSFHSIIMFTILCHTFVRSCKS